MPTLISSLAKALSFQSPWQVRAIDPEPSMASVLVVDEKAP